MRIQGYDEDLAIERKRREEAYLTSTAVICGIAIKQVTPRLLAILTASRTPYLGNADITPEITQHFLWVLAVANPIHSRIRRFLNSWFGIPIKTAKARARFIARNRAIDFEKAESEIWEFLDATFMDAPQGKQSTPYASGVAWMEYSMSAKPFCWAPDYTLEQPIRRIYQLIRCRALDNGATVVNAISDARSAQWLKEVHEKMQTMSDSQKTKFMRQINSEGLN